MDEEKTVAYALAGLSFGVYGFFWGFKRLRKKRKIENIPTSTIRSLAMGLVEITGRAVERKKPLKSALTGTDCVFYRYTIERWRKSGKHGKWVNIAKGDSGEVVFQLDDGTGTVAVLPRGAEYIVPRDYEFKTGWGKSLPAQLIGFMDTRGIKYKALFGNHRLRFREYYICPGEEVYVLGTAKKSRDFLRDRKNEIARRLEALKADPEKLGAADLDGDGRVSEEELSRAAARIEEELLREELKNFQLDELADVIVGLGQTDKDFIISDHSQKKLVKKLTWQAFIGVFGGPALAAACAAYLLYYFNIL